MQCVGLKSMRMTVKGFGPRAFEVYYLSFGKCVVGVIPEMGVSASGWVEPQIDQQLRQALVNLGTIDAASSVSEVETKEQSKPISRKKSSEGGQLF